mmetsp:Transcript_35050/g.78012  ORF Transcript_35050/g.78012 Transcript_35050/m.78012 type:complete len:136 (-) Transcript_35050:477-884(-)
MGFLVGLVAKDFISQTRTDSEQTAARNDPLGEASNLEQGLLTPGSRAFHSLTDWLETSQVCTELPVAAASRESLTQASAVTKDCNEIVCKCSPPDPKMDMNRPLDAATKLDPREMVTEDTSQGSRESKVTGSSPS